MEGFEFPALLGRLQLGCFLTASSVYLWAIEVGILGPGDATASFLTLTGLTFVFLDILLVARSSLANLWRAVLLFSESVRCDVVYEPKNEEEYLYYRRAFEETSRLVGYDLKDALRPPSEMSSERAGFDTGLREMAPILWNWQLRSEPLLVNLKVEPLFSRSRRVASELTALNSLAGSYVVLGLLTTAIAVHSAVVGKPQLLLAVPPGALFVLAALLLRESQAAVQLGFNDIHRAVDKLGEQLVRERPLEAHAREKFLLTFPNLQSMQELGGDRTSLVSLEYRNLSRVPWDLGKIDLKLRGARFLEFASGEPFLMGVRKKWVVFQSPDQITFFEPLVGFAEGAIVQLGVRLDDDSNEVILEYRVSLINLPKATKDKLSEMATIDATLFASPGAVEEGVLVAFTRSVPDGRTEKP